MARQPTTVTVTTATGTASPRRLVSSPRSATLRMLAIRAHRHTRRCEGRANAGAPIRRAGPPNTHIGVIPRRHDVLRPLAGAHEPGRMFAYRPVCHPEGAAREGCRHAAWSDEGSAGIHRMPAQTEPIACRKWTATRSATTQIRTFVGTDRVSVRSPHPERDAWNDAGRRPDTASASTGPIRDRSLRRGATVGPRFTGPREEPCHRITAKGRYAASSITRPSPGR